MANSGYDLDLTAAVAERVHSGIASGGVGTLEHLYDGLVTGRPSWPPRFSFSKLYDSSGEGLSAGSGSPDTAGAGRTGDVMADRELKFNQQGLLPAVIQDWLDGTVLMLGYMNQEALARTLATKSVHFWSRSRQKLWEKGETSGHKLLVKDLFIDCDCDTILVKAQPTGPTCHTGERACLVERNGHDPNEKSPEHRAESTACSGSLRPQRPHSRGPTRPSSKAVMTRF